MNNNFKIDTIEYYNDIIEIYENKIIKVNGNIILEWENIIYNKEDNLFECDMLLNNWQKVKSKYTLDNIIFNSYQKYNQKIIYDKDNNVNHLIITTNSWDIELLSWENVTFFWKYKWKYLANIWYDERKWEDLYINWKFIKHFDDSISFEGRDRINALVRQSFWIVETPIEAFFLDYNINFDEY